MDRLLLGDDPDGFAGIMFKKEILPVIAFM